MFVAFGHCVVKEQGEVESFAGWVFRNEQELTFIQFLVSIFRVCARTALERKSRNREPHRTVTTTRDSHTITDTSSTNKLLILQTIASKQSGEKDGEREMVSSLPAPTRSLQLSVWAYLRTPAALRRVQRLDCGPTTLISTNVITQHTIAQHTIVRVSGMQYF